MTQENDEINHSFEVLKDAAASNLGLPNGYESRIDISYFNDLCKLYGNFRNGRFGKDETMKQGILLRKNYIYRYRNDRTGT